MGRLHCTAEGAIRKTFCCACGENWEFKGRFVEGWLWLWLWRAGGGEVWRG